MAQWTIRQDKREIPPFGINASKPSKILNEIERYAGALEIPPAALLFALHEEQLQQHRAEKAALQSALADVFSEINQLYNSAVASAPPRLSQLLQGEAE
jgi:hypothetical protein